MSIVLKIYSKEIEVENHPGKTILDLARDKGIFIISSCGGKGKCGQCLVDLIEGRFLIGDKEIVASGLRPHKALSCRTRVKGEHAVIEIPQKSLIELSGKIIDDFTLKYYDYDPPTKKYCLCVPQAVLENQTSDRQRMEEEIVKRASIENIDIPLQVLQKLPDALAQGDQTITVTLGCINDYWSMIEIEPGDTTQVLYSIAMDIGTTTVVGGLIDLNREEIIGRASLYNQQITVAEDVISRISSITSHEELGLLKSLVIDETVNPIIKYLGSTYSVKRKDISRIALSGNTVMIHLLLGLDPQSIGKVPFQPVIKTPGSFLATDIGLDIASNGIVDIMPSVSGYIGGDITSDIYVSKLHEEKELSVLIDIGTNGEIVMCENGNMVACSTAAGPAFEGYGLYHGCRATKGAIEKIVFDKEKNIEIKVIGDDKASGICGTGVIDFMAEGLRIGLLNQAGRLNEELLKELQLGYIIKDNGRNIKACIIARNEYSSLNEPIVISEADISKILQAKAAVYAGIKVLLEMQNKTWRDINKLILTGGFGKNINPGNAASIGLLPPVPVEKVEVIGNGSLGGAFLALIESDAINSMNEISTKIDVIELNMQENFQEHYIDAMFLPNRNKEDF